VVAIVVATAVPIIVRVMVAMPIREVTGRGARDQGRQKKSAQPFTFHGHLLEIFSTIVTSYIKAKSIPTFDKRRPGEMPDEIHST